MIPLYLYGNLRTIQGFHKKKYSVNSQLQYPVVEYSGLRNLREQVLSKHRQEMWGRQLVSDVSKDVLSACTYFVPCSYFLHFTIILRGRTNRTHRVFFPVYTKETLSIIQFFNDLKLFLFSISLTNLLRKVMQDLIDVQTYK